MTPELDAKVLLTCIFRTVRDLEPLQTSEHAEDDARSVVGFQSCKIQAEQSCILGIVFLECLGRFCEECNLKKPFTLMLVLGECQHWPEPCTAWE